MDPTKIVPEMSNSKYMDGSKRIGLHSLDIKRRSDKSTYNDEVPYIVRGSSLVMD